MSTSNQGNKPINVLVIGGSDPGCGAGIQADIKTLMRQSAYGLTVLIAVTAQNTMGVNEIYPLPPSIVAAQISALAADFDIAAVKIGMLAKPELVEVVVEAARRYNWPHIVLDPIIRAHTGKLLLKAGGLEVLKERLLPLAEVVTPNITEAETLAKLKIANLDEMKKAALKIGTMGVKNVFLKGGHIGDGATDILLCDNKLTILRGEPVAGAQVHGTGCMLSSIIAAELGKGSSTQAAALKAKETVNQAIKSSLKVGKGNRVADWQHI